MDWKKELFSYRKYTDDIEYNGERVSIEDFYQEFKNRLDREPEVWEGDYALEDNEEELAYGSKKKPDEPECEHIESVERGISTITTYYSATCTFCPDCGVKL